MRYLWLLAALVLAAGCVPGEDPPDGRVVEVDRDTLERALSGFLPVPVSYMAAATIGGIRVNRLDEISVLADNHLERNGLEISVKLTLDYTDLESKSVEVGPGERAVVDFALPFMLDGEHVIMATIEYGKPEDLPEWERELDFGTRSVEKEFDYGGIKRVERIDFPVEIDGDLSEWEDMPYIFVESDSPAEVIRARVYTGWDEHNFYLAVSVEDEKHYNKMEGSRIWDGDSLSFAFVPYEEEAKPVLCMLALAGGKVRIHQSRGEGTGLPEKSEYTVARDDGRKKTFYEMRIPFECIGIEPSGGVMFGFNANINDDDDGSGRDYGIRIASGIGPTWNPANFKSFVLLD